MKLPNFRELLLRKTQDDPNLNALVKYAREEIIIEQVLEALEKMARARHKGDAANFAVRHFATEMDPETEPHMIRDAIGHHVSRYKAALGQNRQDLANRHAKQAFNLMNVADTASKHSGGKLSVDFVAPHPWERSKYTNTYDKSHHLVQEGKYKEGDFTTKTKGLNYALRGNDFSFLQGAPHEHYGYEIKRHGHNKAYPFEQTRVNGKYIPVEDVKDLKGYEEHPFDKHPIMQHFHENPHTRTPERDKQYVEQHEDYYNKHPHIEDFFNRQSQLEEADPEGYAKRGSEAAQAVHPDVPGLDLSTAKTPGKVVAQPQQGDAPIQSTSGSKTDGTPMPAGVKLSQKEWDSLSPSIKAALHEAFNKEQK